MKFTARAGVAALAVTGVVAGLLAIAAPGASSATTVSPVVQRGASAATTTALPTAQVNGIVWAQAVVGNTVYAGGSFATARPAGVAAGGAGEVTRSNIMAYDITTGALTSFAPVLNGNVQAITASPDGSRIYVGGQFTSVDGTNRYRIAAFSTATGALITTWAPSADYIVYSIAATPTTVYLGGAFSNLSGQSRTRLGAVSAANGALLSWAPTADATVRALALAPDGSRVIAAGAFANLNGVSARGLGSIDPSTAQTQAFAANQTVYSYGPKASFYSLAVSGRTVYGTSYNFSGTGNLEGTFAADAITGAVTWIEDCHGDTYSVFPTPDQVYIAGHPHFCANIGGFPNLPAQRALAFTSAVTGTIQKNSQSGYADLGGNPSPSLINWFPNLVPGNVSGAWQAAWSVTGDNRYVVFGGEFLKVNGVAQQGLVRFAVPSIVADKDGPQLTDTQFVPTVSAIGAGVARLSFPANWDQDDMTLDYTVQRDTGSGTAKTTVWTTSARSTFWQKPTLAVADTGLTPGVSYRYRLVATDPAGNQALGAWTTFVGPSSGSPGANRAPIASATATVSADGASVSVDGTGSTDSDGTVARYAWDFGDGSTASTPTATHRYTASGTYTITLTVTDDDAATGTTSLTRSVTVAPVAPTARATASVAGLTAFFDGSTSSDDDGTVTQYAWDFGDGTTGSGATPSHVYAANGTYTATLTVTDNSGLTASTTVAVTVVSNAPVASDDFGRTVTNGWGSADIGGTWTLGGGAAAFAVDGNVGTQTLSAPGATTSAVLAGVTAGDTTTTFDSTVTTAATGKGITVSSILRRAGTNDYRVKLILLPDNVVHLAVSRVVGGTETVLREVNVPNLGYTPGTALRLQASVSGSGANTVTGTVWKVGDTAPAGPQISVADSTAALASPGAVGVTSYLSASATTRGVVVAVDGLVVRAR